MEILKIYLEEQLMIKYCVIKLLILPKKTNYNGRQKWLASGDPVKSEIMSNQKVVKELHRQIIRKFEKEKVHSSLTENMQCAIISKFDKGILFLLCVIDIYSKCA